MNKFSSETDSMKLLLFFLCFTFSISGFSQINNFDKVLALAEVGKKVVIKGKSARSEQIYLGSIKDEKGIIVYHVIREFGTIQAAKQKHGYSRLVFFDAHNVHVAEYRVGLPSELPSMLLDNAFYFGFKNNPEGSYRETVGIDLPEYLCVSPDECYERQ